MDTPDQASTCQIVRLRIEHPIPSIHIALIAKGLTSDEVVAHRRASRAYLVSSTTFP